MENGFRGKRGRAMRGLLRILQAAWPLCNICRGVFSGGRKARQEQILACTGELVLTAVHLEFPIMPPSRSSTEEQGRSCVSQ